MGKWNRTFCQNPHVDISKPSPTFVISGGGQWNSMFCQSPYWILHLPMQICCSITAPAIECTMTYGGGWLRKNLPFCYPSPRHNSKIGRSRIWWGTQKNISMSFWYSIVYRLVFKPSPPTRTKVPFCNCNEILTGAFILSVKLLHKMGSICRDLYRYIDLFQDLDLDLDLEI